MDIHKPLRGERGTLLMISTCHERIDSSILRASNCSEAVHNVSRSSFSVAGIAKNTGDLCGDRAVGAAGLRPGQMLKTTIVFISRPPQEVSVSVETQTDAGDRYIDRT